MYLQSLRECLAWLENAGETTVEDMEIWVQQQYSVKQSTANIYIRVIAVLDLMRKTRTGIEITRWGQVVLLNAADDQVRNNLIVLLKYKYEGFSEILSLIAQSTTPITLEQIAERLDAQYPRWSALNQYRERVLWMRAFELVESVGVSETHEITGLGKLVAFGERVKLPTLTSAAFSEAQWLGERIIDASVESDDHTTFELAVKAAFEFLGFETQYFGQRGKTDILLSSALTVSAVEFRAIVDSKARGSGGGEGTERLNALDVMTLQDHMRRHAADFILVVAPAFGGGKVIQRAQENKITLLTAQQLSELLQLHEQYAFSVNELVSIFYEYGLLSDWPAPIMARHQRQIYMSQLLWQIVTLLEEMAQTATGIQWREGNLHSALVVRTGIAYKLEEVQEALDLLQHPAIGVVVVDEQQQLHLVMKWNIFVARLSSLTRLLLETERKALL
jgi:hypothetical protein